jgi:hypothetical protein
MEPPVPVTTGSDEDFPSSTDFFADLPPPTPPKRDDSPFLPL